jgi:hypothetical protein
MRLTTVAALLVLSAVAIAEPNSGRDMLVVVLQRQNGARQTHSQSIAADDCSAMLKLFKELREKGQSLALDLSGPTGATAEALDIYCIDAKGEGVDWHGAAVSGEQIQQRTDELITKEPK